MDQKYGRLERDDTSQSGSEQETLLDEKDAAWAPRPKKARLNRWQALIAVLGLLAYTGLVVLATSMWWREAQLHGANVMDSPLRPWYRFESKMFTHTHETFSTEDQLMGYPSDELDQRWHEIMKHFYAKVPASYIEKLGRLDEAIPTDDGNYIAVYNFMHDLHCLKRVHQAYWPERYLPNMTEEERTRNFEHNLHCLEVLTEAIMCKPDISPLTSRWWATTKLPTGNPTIPHECVNWELLMEHMDEIAVDPFAPGVLVHPTFGAVAPQGQDSVIPNRIGYYSEVATLLVPDHNSVPDSLH